MRTVSYCIFPVSHDDGNCFERFTDLELKLIYTSMTGLEWPHIFKRKAVIQVLVDMCLEAPETKAKLSETLAQSDYVDVNDDKDWTYVYGAKRPTIQTELFPSVTVAVNKEAEAKAVAGETPAVANKPKLNLEPTQGVEQRVSTAAAKPKRAASKAPKGITALIRAEAQQAWEAAGKPVEKDQLTEIRKAVRDKFIEEGVNKNTLSVQLSKWQKTILGTSS